MLDVVHLQEQHLHHLEEKLQQMNNLLADLLESNIWFSSKVTNTIEKKFQSVVHHHENVVKSAQHHWLAPGALPHDVLDGIIMHVLQVAIKKNLVQFVKFASDLFQIEVSHLYMPAIIEFTLTLQVPIISNANLLNLYKFFPLPIHFNFAANISITRMSEQQTSSPLDTLSHYKLFPAPIYTPASTSETLSFAKEGR